MERGKELDRLEYAEEREIYNKGQKLLEKLINTTVIQTFRNKLDSSIKKFNSKKQAVLILRAQYAVITCVNGINFFGQEGLKMKMQKELVENIGKIEKKSRGKDFPDKEKLMADCVRAIANYICITWNEGGVNSYTKGEVSKDVFKLFENYLKKSQRPLNSYLMLKAFREWLINRIEIIESATNQEREIIYDPESYLMVPHDIKDQIITDVMDSLYLTHQKFATNEKVVALNMEVIILLGYVYPQWKLRVGKNFIPQILDALNNDIFSEETDRKGVELLKHLCGVDDKSEEPNYENVDAALSNDGLNILIKSIADNNYNDDYLQHCQPLLDIFG